MKKLTTEQFRKYIDENNFTCISMKHLGGPDNQYKIFGDDNYGEVVEVISDEHK